MRAEHQAISDATRDDSVSDLITSGLMTDGGHHKQWFLEAIALKLGIDISHIDYSEEGIAP